MMKRFWGALAFIFLLFLQQHSTGAGDEIDASSSSFIRRNGTRFFLDGRPFYPNGFNAYWMLQKAAEPSEKEKVSTAFRQAARYGMNVARTWAFNDGLEQYKPLQTTPGVYDEGVFKALDFIISEANKYGIYLILSLVNNFEDFGGKQQYIKWVNNLQQICGNNDGEQQLQLDSAKEDDFFSNEIAKGIYRNHVKTVLFRKNSLTGVLYKDDPTIFAWELINEARCPSDTSGITLQAWIEEMAPFVKSLDENHMVEVGLEGFYGHTMKEERSGVNLGFGFQMGTDFIANNLVPEVDFATIHAYPDAWKPGSDHQWQLSFMRRWIGVHAMDATRILKKPLLLTEFGRSRKYPTTSGSDFVQERDEMYEAAFSSIYGSARAGGAGAGTLFWQLLVPGMDNMRDGYEVILSESPSTANLISRHTRRISDLVNSFSRSRPRLPALSGEDHDKTLMQVVGRVMKTLRNRMIESQADQMVQSV